MKILNLDKVERCRVISFQIPIWCGVGFGRIAKFDSFQYSFAVTNIPLWIPKHVSFDILRLWVFSLGNLVAFIPFGVLIPLNFQTVRNVFLKSLAIFINRFLR